ncbi:hypothetical protein GCM10009799_08320 [Nocardiopsis rhodophaea]|uniref:Transcriptional regulator MraZ n=1 Tax=Nocardiopsis rhodophaea TaxID=280238 RepID=A0ABN2SFQ8_9ACTN
MWEGRPSNPFVSYRASSDTSHLPPVPTLMSPEANGKAVECTAERISGSVPSGCPSGGTRHGPPRPLHSPPPHLNWGFIGETAVCRRVILLTVGESGVEWSIVEQETAPAGLGRWFPVFLGSHSPRLDEKGRLFLPAKYRDELSGGLVITKGQERCLYVFPMEEFQRITEALRSAPVTAKAVRDYSRVFFASASDEIPDKQGRITIPPALRGYAGLDRDCVVIGANTRLEIWDARAWADYEAEQEQAFADLSEEVLPGV